MKSTQMIQVQFKGENQTTISVFTSKRKVKDTFDYYTAEAVNAALYSIDKEKSIGIVGEFGNAGIKRSLQVRLID